MAKLKSGTRIYGTATIDTSVVVGSAVTANSSGIQVTGVVTATSLVIGGIASVTQLNVSGISTLGTVRISSGIVTATVGIVTYYGDGSKLSGINAGGATYATSAGIATYATSAGIATYATNAGIATNLKGGAGGQIHYQSAADTTAFLANGSAGQVLQSNGTTLAPSWTTISTNYAAVAGVATNVRGTANRILYNSATDTTTTSSNLTFNGTDLAVAGVTTANAYRSNFTTANGGTGSIFVGNGVGLAVTTFAGNANTYDKLIGFGFDCLKYVYETGGGGGGNYFAPQVAIGHGCLQSVNFNTGGNGGRSFGTNIAIGYECARNASGGGGGATNLNVLVGYQVAYVNDFGGAAYNNIFGTQSGYNLSSGTGNSLFGYQAGFNVTGGSYNVAIGYAAGVTNLTGSQNVVIGYNRDVPIAAGSNQLVIGSGSNDWIYGNSSYNVGIGTTRPTSKLDIVGNVKVVGIVTATLFSGTLSGIASVTSLSVSGFSTFSGITTHTADLFGTQASFSGILTANSFRGDGSALTGIVANVGISTNGINQNQYLTYAIGTGTTNALGITTGLVFNPSSGNLGIGTTNPLQKTHILGNLLVAAGSSVGQHITQKPYEINNGTLSWEGSAGQLFSITNNLTSGSIFSVNDVSGIPSIDVNANGTINLGAYGGFVGIGTTNPVTKLHVVGDVTVNGTIYADGLSNLVVASTATTSQTSIYSGLSTAIYRSVEFTIQTSQANNHHVTKIMTVHNGTTAYNSEYGTIYTNNSLGTFDVDVSGGNLRLLVTPASSSTTNYKITYFPVKI